MQLNLNLDSSPVRDRHVFRYVIASTRVRESACNQIKSMTSWLPDVVIVQAFYAQKGPFTKQIATEGFSTVLGQSMSPL